MKSQIIFCKLNEPYGEFSNFYPSTMEIDGYIYNTVENYYQSKKFEGTEYEHVVRVAKTPYQAKQLAYSDDAKKYFDKRWEDKKLSIMGKALRKKFNIDQFKNLLLSTGNIEIIEYSNRDYFWGKNNKGEGLNMLGRLLMEIREDIKTKNSKKYF